MIARVMIVAACLGVASAVLANVKDSEVVPARESLARFPMEIAAWQGDRAPDFDEAILAELGVDEYVNARYQAPAHNAVGLYIGYYTSQRQGDTIHSPANCLPGAGWQPIDSRRLTVQVPAVGGVTGLSTSLRPIEINRWVIERAEERQLVLYWYQSHGRVTASEYWNKFYLLSDAMRLNRTDGALIRVITPIAPDSSNPLEEAERHAVSFVASMFPFLNRFLPV